MEQRLKTLLYNAICYMIEDLSENPNADIIEDICDYLGATESELRELEVLDLC